MAAGMLIPACVPPPVAPQPVTPPAALCNSLSVQTCALPFPSNEFTVPDASSPTGIRIALPDELVRSNLLEQLPERARPSELFQHVDGFSPSGPIVFEFNGSVDPSTIPADGGTAIQVFDRATGTRIDVDVDVWEEAGARGATNQVLLVWPATRFPFAHTLVAFATTSIKGAKGTLSRGTGVDAAMANSEHPATAFAASRGIAPEQVLSFTEFTVQSSASATALVDEMAASTREVDHPIRNLSVLPNLLGIPGVSSIVSGEVRTTDFRTHPDGGIARPLRSETRWVSFLMTVPEYAPSTGAPVVIYSHGIGIPKETMILVAGHNAQQGMATISIDVPNHGNRVNSDGGYVFDLVTPRQLMRLGGMLLQSTSDHISLLSAVLHHLKSLDVAPFNLFQPTSANGRPDLDVKRIYSEGTSLGGFTGASFLAQAPEVRGGTYQVTGTGALHDLSSTFFWKYGLSDKGGFRGVIPSGATGGEAAFLLALAQTVVEPGDSINLLDRIKERNVPFQVVYTVDDGVVSNETTRALLALTGTPIYGKVIRAEPSLGYSPKLPENGKGAMQLDPSPVPPMGPLSDIRDLVLHTLFIGDVAAFTTREWFAQRLQTP